MTRFAVGNFTTASSVSTFSVGTTVSAVLGLGGSSASADSTMASICAVGAGFRGGSDGGHQSEAYGAWFQGSSAKTSASSVIGIAGIRSTDGAVSTAFLGTISSTHLSVLGGPLAAPVGYAVIAGDDVSNKSTEVSVSTVLSTQASTGYGFQPNAAFLVGHSFASSVANFSFGVAVTDTAGNRSQWSISQTGREAANAVAHKSASTVSALKLHTSASTAHDVEVTSFRSDGLELTVNATDTARAATISILGLSVPKANAGKATITTNGAGTGQTGFTVSNIGQNVGLVILASIGSSLQTLQDDNMFSIGFASSNGNQRAVSGHVTQGGGASTRYASYFGTSHAVVFVSGSSGVHPSITDPPAVITKGVYALDTASSGFTVTFDNTAANGWDVYWAALSNVVTDIGGSIQSSFNANSGLTEVGHIGGAIQAAFTEALGLTKEFEVTRGGVAGDATIETRADDGTLRWYSKTTNSTSPDVALYFDITTTPQRIGLAEYQNARHVSIIPPSTNTHPFRIAASRQSPGVLVSSQGANSFPIPEDAGSDMYLYTSVSSATIAKARVVVR